MDLKRFNLEVEWRSLEIEGDEACVKLRILSLAEADLLDGFRFYERQSSGIGSYFLETLYSDIQSLLLYAGVHRRVFGHRRMLSKRFPFCGLLASWPSRFVYR